MKTEIRNFKVVAARYKKWVILAAVSGLVVLTLGTVTFGFVVYKAVSFASEKVKSFEVSRVSPEVTLPKSGFIEEVAFDVATGWLRQSLASNEVISFKNGLACFDAMGGPSPLAVVDYLKAKVNDHGIEAGLNSVADSLKHTGLPASGSAACANWILSS